MSFTWHFGDGTTRTTVTPGAPYPDLEVTHNYTRKDTYRPYLATTWAAQYRVAGGPWQAVPGTIITADEPQRLEAITARPLLVAPDGS